MPRISYCMHTQYRGVDNFLGVGGLDCDFFADHAHFCVTTPPFSVQLRTYVSKCIIDIMSLRKWLVPVQKPDELSSEISRTDLVSK